MNYYAKYIKYKTKYLGLVAQIDKTLGQVGGGAPTIMNPDRINLFTDRHMEQYLNPIYGLVLYKSGFLTNTWHLHDSGFIATPLSKVIKKCCHYLPDGLTLTNDIAQKLNLKPRDFGRYIAIKYINMGGADATDVDGTGGADATGVDGTAGADASDIDGTAGADASDIGGNGGADVRRNTIIKPISKLMFIYPIQNNREAVKLLTEYVNKLNRFIPVANNHKIYFHIILYCMWCTAGNDEGIAEYYQGINDVFGIIRQCVKCVNVPKYDAIDIASTPPDNEFESTLIKMTQENFIILGQEWPHHFCKTHKKPTYPACGEVMARNLINLLCFNGERFDINMLDRLHPIPELCDYYKQFGTFQSQSVKYPVEGAELNATDAWSALIISHANYNINFANVCTDPDVPRFSFELNGGLATDNKTSNFFQLIKNLFRGVRRWEDLGRDGSLIIRGTADTGIGDSGINGTGIGEISITHGEFGRFILHCMENHYYIEHINDTPQNIDYSNLPPRQQGIIDLLLFSDVSSEKYDWVKFNPNIIFNLLYGDIPYEIVLKLLQLSITSQFDSDLRRRIRLNVETKLFDDFLNMCKDNGKVSERLKEYTYSSNNFQYMENEPIKQLGIIVKINNHVSEIDLSPLQNEVEIGDNFLAMFQMLKRVVLSLQNVEIIGSSFLADCIELEHVDSPSLQRVKTIGDNFLKGCRALKGIDLTSLQNVGTIGDNFLNSCFNLKSANLSSLEQVGTIGGDFLNRCESLEKIDLSSLQQVGTIGSYFLHGCTGLKEINLSSLQRVGTIGSYFLHGCKELKKINLSSLQQVETINSDFLSICSSLEEIDLSSLQRVGTIGNKFLSSCNKLERVNLSSLRHIGTIGNNFLFGCNMLKSLDLSPLQHIGTIGVGFLHKCVNLKYIVCSAKQRELVTKSLSPEHRKFLRVSYKLK